jgi:hypothetical protein
VPPFLQIVVFSPVGQGVAALGVSTPPVAHDSQPLFDGSGLLIQWPAHARGRSRASTEPARQAYTLLRVAASILTPQRVDDWMRDNRR